MDMLLDFTQKYIFMVRGWNSISQILPESLTLPEQKIYVAMALWVDYIGRPIKEAIFAYEQILESQTRSMEYPCKLELGTHLALLGLNIGVDAFLDAMSGGATIIPTTDIAVLGAVDVWLSYEACCGRYH